MTPIELLDQVYADLIKTHEESDSLTEILTIIDDLQGHIKDLKNE